MPEPLPNLRNDPIFTDLLEDVIRAASIVESCRGCCGDGTSPQMKLNQATEDLICYVNERLAVVAISPVPSEKTSPKTLTAE